jgi:hypothetical protein
MKRLFFLGMLVIVLASQASWQALGVPVTVDITATVTDVVGDFSGISPGNEITGMYMYDDETEDAYPADPTMGVYKHSSPYGIRLESGGYYFRTDPGHTEFSITYMDFPPSFPWPDTYNLNSKFNISDLLTDSFVINWSLQDPTCSALSSDELLTEPPDSADTTMWPVNCLEVKVSSSYYILARVGSAELRPIPEPAAILLLTMGLFGVGFCGKRMFRHKGKA